MSHAHLTLLVLALIFLIIIAVLQNKGRNIRIWHIVLRATYILIIVTGGMLFFAAYSIPLSYYLKAILGIFMISLFEMVIVQKQKGKITDVIWIAFSLVLVILFAPGFTLPMGYDLLK